MLVKQRRARPQQQQQNQEEEEKKGEPALQNAQPQQAPRTFYAIIKLERDTLSQEQTLLIGSKLDAETAQKQCRLCFYGQVLALFPSNQSPEERSALLESLHVIKHKQKAGKVDKVVND